MNTAFFFVNGIRTKPGDGKNWNGRAVTHVHCLNGRDLFGPCVVAEKIEYFSLAIARPWGQPARAEKLARTAHRYDLPESGSWKKIAVAHSNGCDVVCDALQNYPALAFDAVHLVCAACEADFGKNGLNTAMRQGRVKKVFVYVAGKDSLLRLASRWMARTLLGYGTLGLSGPLNVGVDYKSRVTTVREGAWRSYDHSDCWSDDNFENTMGQLINPP